MHTQVAIIGGGVGGTVTANRLIKSLHGERRQTVDITIYETKRMHTYQPGWLYVPFSQFRPMTITRPEVRLLHEGIILKSGTEGTVTSLDTNTKTLVTADGISHRYDYLIFATGARNVPEEVAGYAEGSDHFYSEEAARALRAKLDAFEGGVIVTGVSSIPHRCPPAPLEFTFLLDDMLRKQGLREKTEIHYVYPINRVFPIESVAELAAPILEERGIQVHTFFNVDEIHPEKKLVTSLEGEELSYDLLVLTPPHQGSALAKQSGISDADGWIPTDHHTLRVKGYEDANIFAIGDSTDLPVSKSGAAAHFEGIVVAETIADELRGRAPAHTYEGRVVCFLETGRNQASILWFDYKHPPKPPKPSLFWHLDKTALNRFYWEIIPPAIA